MSATNAQDIVNNIRLKKAKHVIGVGVSAGALSALKVFFENLPSDLDCAIIVVQHLSPDFDTLMDELLEKHCSMPMCLAEDCLEIETNHVYLLPERKHLSVASNKIILSEMDDRPVQYSIDYFFRSLAEEYQDKAITVILTGTGEDGSGSLKYVHDAGGLILVQNPETAEFNGMPLNAIRTGFVDKVLDVEGIGNFISRHIESQSDRKKQNLGLNLDAKRMRKLQGLLDDVNSSCQINLANYKLTTIERRIQHRMVSLRLNSFDEYVDYFQAEQNEKKLLVDDISIGVTQFFRNEEAWEVVSSIVIERLILESTSQDIIRVWVPGCSSGEEAYTISILFQEVMESLSEERDVRIFASDIDRVAIRHGGLGVYSHKIEKDIPAELLAKYFTKQNDGYAVVERIKRRVMFAAHNLIEDPPFSSMDFVSCRNILIYFQANAQKSILSFLHFALRTNGFFLLGESETTSNLSEHFVQIDKVANVYKRAKNTRISLSQVGLDDRLERHKRNLLKHSETRQYPKMFDGTIPRLKEKLFSRFVPASFVLDKDHNVIHSFGDTDLYTRKIRPGSQSLHFSNIVQTSLVSVIGSLIKEIDKSRKPLLIKNVRIFESDIDVTIDACFQAIGEDIVVGHYIFSFVPQTLEINKREDVEAAVQLANIKSDSKLLQLDAELLDARALIGEQQQDVDALTEEIQATNEELMAANEELQSTNEELHSVNEELFTVNTEYQAKIEELTQSNKDLDSLLNATDVGVVYLDKNFLIRRFTPKSRDYIKLLPMDTNRPFTDIALNFDIKDLEKDLGDVRRSNEQKNLVIKKHRGRKARILLSINPYLDKDDNFEGIILVFQDLEAFERIAAGKDHQQGQ